MVTFLCAGDLHHPNALPVKPFQINKSFLMLNTGTKNKPSNGAA